ncbi:MAG: phytanoyl-CoA dioxygenase family protein, partial [Actinomycetota bacterium]
MRATFKDPVLQETLERQGFAVLPMLSEEEVAFLRSEYHRLGPAPGDPQKACQSSFHSYDADYKQAVDDVLQKALKPHLDEVFDRQRALPCNYIVKWPGGMGGFGLHQDLALVDETEHRSVECWIALEDTNETNGQLWMVPQSHRWMETPNRGIQAFPFAYAEMSKRIIKNHAVPVPVTAGTAVVFNHATLHFSLPNRSDEPRMVAITDLIPEEAQHLHYFGDDDGNVGVYEIDDAFWVDNSPHTLHKPPDASRRVGTVEYQERALTAEGLDRLVAE